MRAMGIVFIVFLHAETAFAKFSFRIFRIVIGFEKMYFAAFGTNIDITE